MCVCVCVCNTAQYRWNATLFNYWPDPTWLKELSPHEDILTRDHRDRQTDRQTERQTERETQTDRDGETDRQTDRQTDRHTNRQTDRQTDRERDRQRERETHGESDRQTEGQTDRQTDRRRVRQTDRQRDRQRDRQTERQTDGESDRQTDRQTDRHWPMRWSGCAARSWAAVSQSSRAGRLRPSVVCTDTAGRLVSACGRLLRGRVSSSQLLKKYINIYISTLAAQNIFKAQVSL